MADIYKVTKNYEPISLTAVDLENGETLAVLLAVIIRDTSGLVGEISLRSIINGGPLFVEGERGLEALEKLLNYYEQYLRNRAIYTQIRNICSTEKSRNKMESLGYEYEPHLNYLIDLSRSTEEIWGDIHRSRRRGVKRAEKAEFKIRKIEDEKEIRDCYKVIEEIYKDVNLPLADISLFESAYENLFYKGFIDFYLAILNGDIVGSRIYLNYNSRVYEWYAGSKQEINYVNQAIVWAALSEYAGKEKVFDFGGAGHPDKPYGVREFKKSFGGQEVNYGRYKKVHSKAREEILKSGLKIYRSVGKYVNLRI
jgi:lipid II:glycine glycyltransferase (peptidoglycan interpeptide bridge formation enzyme)